MTRRMLGCRLARGVVPALLVLLMAALPVLGACGGGEETEKTITVGLLEDFTGSAGYAVSQTFECMMDYFSMDENAIPGIKVRVITYDTRMDYSRVLPGYVWLKGQGADIMFNVMSTFAALARANVERDGIPFISGDAIPTLEGSDWIRVLFPGQNYKAEAAMQWFLEEWERRGGDTPLKVGAISTSGYEAPELMEEAVQNILSDNPGKIEYQHLYSAQGQTTFALELSKLKECDYIYSMGVYGAGLPNFFNEARSRGFTGTFLTHMDLWSGFWNMIAPVVPLENLDGSLGLSSYVLWTDDIGWVADLDELLQEHQPDNLDFHKANTFWLVGMFYGRVMAEIIGQAAENVGADNVDSAALRDAMVDLEMTIPGWGEDTWAFGDGSVLQKTLRMYEYDASEDAWYGIGDWYLPISLAE